MLDDPASPKRSRPSLRRRLLNTINDATQGSLAWSGSSSKPVTVLRKKRRDDQHFAPRAVSAERYSAPRDRDVLANSLYATAPRHSRIASEPHSRPGYGSTSSLSSPELFTPISEHPAMVDVAAYSAASERSLHIRPGPGHELTGKDMQRVPDADTRRRDSSHSQRVPQPWLAASPPTSSRPPSPASFSTAPSSPDLVAFPPQEHALARRGAVARPHSSSDYYRLHFGSEPVDSGHQGHAHVRCLSNPDAPPAAVRPQALVHRPSQLALQLSCERDLPPLPDECAVHDESAVPDESALDTSESDGPQTPPEEFHLLAPGTFSSAVSQEEDYPDEEQPPSSEDRRRSLPRARSHQSSREVVDALREDKAALGRRNSLLARAASLSRATSLKWKSVARRRRGTAVMPGPHAA